MHKENLTFTQNMIRYCSNAIDYGIKNGIYDIQLAATFGWLDEDLIARFEAMGINFATIDVIDLSQYHRKDGKRTWRVHYGHLLSELLKAEKRLQLLTIEVEPEVIGQGRWNVRQNCRIVLSNN